MTVTRRRASPRRDMVITSYHRHLQSFLSILTILLLLSLTEPGASMPTSYFPLNSQLPPVARVSEPFSFVFSPLTFSSDEVMSYTLARGSPSWLSLDSASRVLSGTPDEASIPSGETLIGVIIALVASDNTGSTTANATLVVSRSRGPTVRKPLLDQIKKFGPYSAPASILLRPSSEFEFEFDPNTFGVDVAGDGNDQGRAHDGRSTPQNVKRGEDEAMSGPELQLNYYAISGNNAPLPSWIAFNAEKLAFSGKTPGSESLVQPPQRFDFQLVASDVVGFASAAVDFSIVVGTHELTAEEPIIKLNATRGKQFEYTDIPDILKLDKKPLKAEDVSSIKADGLPEWLSFDEESWKVSGTPDPEAQSANITITVVDKFLGALNVTLAIKLDTKIFVSDLPSLNVSAGDDFSFDLKRFLFAPKDTQLTAETQPNYSWIRFDDSSNILSGTVPKPLNTDFANEIRITFNATQGRTKEKEAKSLNIHVNKLIGTNELPPARAPAKGGDSRRDLYWLLIIPVLIIAVAITLSVFIVRKRRHQPRKLDFSEVSGPVPGTFVANGFMDPSLDEIRKMVDAGAPGPYMHPRGYTPAASSTLQKSQTTSNPSSEADHVPQHAMATYSRTTKPARKRNAVVESKESWLVSRRTRPSPTGTDEVSLLSDTSRRREVPNGENWSREKRGLGENAHEKKIELEVPGKGEPFSIQPTPELAYTAAGRYDYVSDEDTQTAIGSTGRSRSGHQRNLSISLRGAKNRLSKAWKRVSPSKLGDTKRHSHHSASTDVTTCTSILTSGVTEEATTASANVVAKPTVIHISGRPGEARQMSRRTDGSTAFFGGGSLTKSQRNFRLEKDAVPGLAYSPGEDAAQPATFKGQDIARDDDMTWDHLARNALGIAYSDLIQTNQAHNENWNTDARSQGLMSPSQWPIPGVAPGLAGTADVFRSQSEPPQLPLFQLPTKVELPVTPMGKGKKRASPTRRMSRICGSISTLSQSPSAHTRSKGRSSREERVRISRIREQKALDEFRAMMSHTPSPQNEWAPPTRVRPLPETPSRTSRPPLTNHPNEPRGLMSTISKRSVKTLRSNKSVRSARADGDDDDDAWEDIPPPESTIFGWEGEGSDGSFPVYI
ncbi:hypothetical protein E0Z10_g6533 [Xylaria hypoxylon]|uniref:Dystroglycan-type cadherin-like domain-containing protein n=1 Tax=Xylaria hypoxylon TaxID=37992 RepID=A0A4Z0YS72_9PEZI|nr:hypothetical protein E0Z10_g6533 [Xylaria hypoxylon]